MPTTIEQKIITAASANAGLQNLLGTNPFRMYDTQEVVGSPFPTTTLMTVSDTKSYTAEGRNNLARYRVQFTIWGGQFAAGAAQAAAVRDALMAFLDGFSAVRNGQVATQVVLERRGLFPLTDGPTWQRILDAMIYSDDSL